MVNENNDRRGDSAEGVTARVREDIKAMASADEQQGAVVGQSVDASFAPDTGRRLTTTEKLRFAIGFVLVSLLWAAPFTMGSGVLLPQIFNSLHGVSAEGLWGQ